MNKFTKLVSSTLLMSVFALHASAQQGTFGCGIAAAEAEMLKKYPTEIAAEQEKLRLETEAFAKQAHPRGQVYTIPVVFHIIHLNGSENISDEQIHDQIRILNEDFRKLNSDTADIIPEFKGIAADAEIEFQLAKKDPNGNCHNGIDRIYSEKTIAGSSGQQGDQSKLNPWPRAKYLNVWVIRSFDQAGLIGYTTKPATANFSPNTDGIILVHNSIGTIGTGSPNLSRSLTHEIGHWINLSHTWGDTNQPGVSCGDDNITDTPKTKGHQSCPLSDATCTAGVIENLQNYMEYSFCSNMFTAKQVVAMRAALASSTAQRSTLWSAANLAAVGLDGSGVACAPKANFLSDRKLVCVGGAVKFTDFAEIGTPTGWEWTFQGGTPATSTDSMPTVVYNTPGVYDVTLKLSNAAGAGAPVTKTGYIVVRSASTATTGVFFESFESIAVPSNDWLVYDNNNQPWTKTTTAAYTGTASMKLVANPVGNVDEFVTPAFNLTGITAPKLYYRVAHAAKATTNTDQLRVQVSTNCGQTWVQRSSKSSATLKTVSTNVTGAFTPTAAQWRLDSVPLTSYATSTNLMIKFEFTAGGGNAIYIDDINIRGAASVGINEAIAEAIDLNIYPNPTQGQSQIAFNLNQTESVTIQVYDMLGKEMETLAKGNLSGGQHLFAVNTDQKYHAGIYFIRLQIGSHSLVRKLIIK